MDITRLFTSTPKISSTCMTVLNFPGNCGVAAIDGKSLFPDHENLASIKHDLFICAEKALEALGTVTPKVTSNTSVYDLTWNSSGLYKRVIVEDVSDEEWTFVPLSLLCGRVLATVHNFDLPSRLRLIHAINRLLQASLDAYPKLSSPVVIDDEPEKDRIKELRLTPEEFEECQKEKYGEAYKKMRGFIPINIFSTDYASLERNLQIPEELAQHIWNRRALWLICVHPDDITKIHIADLRTKYTYVDLDVVEMRAIWHQLPLWKGDSVKADWRIQFKRHLDSLVQAEIVGDIAPYERRNPVYASVEEKVFFDPTLPLPRLKTQKSKVKRASISNADLISTPSHSLPSSTKKAAVGNDNSGVKKPTKRASADSLLSDDDMDEYEPASNSHLDLLIDELRNDTVEYQSSHLQRTASQEDYAFGSNIYYESGKDPVEHDSEFHGHNDRETFAADFVFPSDIKRAEKAQHVEQTPTTPMSMESSAGSMQTNSPLNDSIVSDTKLSPFSRSVNRVLRKSFVRAVQTSILEKEKQFEHEHIQVENDSIMELSLSNKQRFDALLKSKLPIDVKQETAIDGDKVAGNDSGYAAGANLKYLTDSIMSVNNNGSSDESEQNISETSLSLSMRSDSNHEDDNLGPINLDRSKGFPRRPVRNDHNGYPIEGVKIDNIPRDYSNSNRSNSHYSDNNSHMSFASRDSRSQDISVSSASNSNNNNAENGKGKGDEDDGDSLAAITNTASEFVSAIKRIILFEGIIGGKSDDRPSTLDVKQHGNNSPPGKKNLHRGVQSDIGNTNNNKTQSSTEWKKGEGKRTSEIMQKTHNGVKSRTEVLNETSQSHRQRMYEEYYKVGSGTNAATTSGNMSGNIYHRTSPQSKNERPLDTPASLPVTQGPVNTGDTAVTANTTLTETTNNQSVTVAADATVTINIDSNLGTGQNIYSRLGGKDGFRREKKKVDFDFIMKSYNLKVENDLDNDKLDVNRGNPRDAIVNKVENSLNSSYVDKQEYLDTIQLHENSYFNKNIATLPSSNLGNLGSKNSANSTNKKDSKEKNKVRFLETVTEIEVPRHEMYGDAEMSSSTGARRSRVINDSEEYTTVLENNSRGITNEKSPHNEIITMSDFDIVTSEASQPEPTQLPLSPMRRPNKRGKLSPRSKIDRAANASAKKQFETEALVIKARDKTSRCALITIDDLDGFILSTAEEEVKEYVISILTDHYREHPPSWKPVRFSKSNSSVIQEEDEEEPDDKNSASATAPLLFNQHQVSQLLLKFFRERGSTSLSYSFSVAHFFIDVLYADVNAQESPMQLTCLHMVINNPILSRFFISRGGDIFLTDVNNVSPLSLALECQLPGVFQAYSLSGREADLMITYNMIIKRVLQILRSKTSGIDKLRGSNDSEDSFDGVSEVELTNIEEYLRKRASSGDQELICNMTSADACKIMMNSRQYAYSLCLGGFANQLKDLVSQDIFVVSSDAAVELLMACRENAETMQEPAETFVILENIILQGK